MTADYALSEIKSFRELLFRKHIPTYKDGCEFIVEFGYDSAFLCAIDTVIESLENMRDVNDMIDEIESTDWYRLVDGKLVHGAATEEEALYKANEILAICDKYRSEDE